MDIEEIPGFAALQQLGCALWKGGKAAGAAVLVGAGFTLNAERVHANTPKPPRWPELAGEMQRRMCLDTGEKKDFLRVAEEFKILLGESALEGLIRDMVRDEEWLPGILHKRLVKLPWTDILTTNWDTLLERAALENIGQTYETVRCIQDIATTRAPRVVKLHGSLPSNRPFIVAEEDYRTYPRIFAPFVNLVQQVLLENELCLLGFSGDDPNFLKWSGWVRDQLGVSARRIHLVGALNLSAATQKLLESRNISVIDFGPLVAELGEVKHEAAASKFIDYLEKAKPRARWEWPQPHKAAPPKIASQETPSRRLSDIRETLPKWKAERLLYPGWVVCPPSIRSTLKHETIEILHLLEGALDQLSPQERGSMAFESAWRMETLFVPLQDSMRTLFRRVVLDDNCWRGQDRDSVALLLLRTARESRDDASFKEWSEYFTTHIPSDSETATHLAYQRCLWARDELNFEELRRTLVDVRGPDPIWKLRQAGLLCYLGDLNGARDAVSTGLREIRQNFFRDRDAVGTISRLAWAHFLSRGLRSWMDTPQDDPPEESDIFRVRFFESKSDPWDCFDALDMKIADDLRRIVERNKTKEPEFEAGVYRDHSSTMHFGMWWPTEALYEIHRIVDAVGIPPRAGNNILVADRLERAELLTEYEYSDTGDFLRVVRVAEAAGENFVKSVFSRMRVATIPECHRTHLENVLNCALGYALVQLSGRKGFSDNSWSHRAAMYTEIISRLSIRDSDSQALALFHRALSFGKDTRWSALDLHEVLGRLLERSLSAISPRSKRTLLTEMLSFPLPQEAGIHSQVAHNWPEAADWLNEKNVSRPNPDNQFVAVVSNLIAKAATGDTVNRPRALRRLSALFLGGVLNSEEREQLGRALWSRQSLETGLPVDTSLYPHMFLLLPSPEKDVTRKLFLQNMQEPPSAHDLVTLGNASRKQKDGSRALVFSKEEALKLLHHVLNWQPKKEPQFDLGDVRRENELARAALGAILADGILPCLTGDDVTNSWIEQCLFLIENNVIPSIAQALPDLIRVQPSLQERAANAILRMIFTMDVERNVAGFQAVYRWTNVATEKATCRVPRRLVDAVVNTVEMRRQPGLFHALRNSRKMLECEVLTELDTERLRGALQSIIIETDYSHHSVDGPENIGVTLVRAEAVRLADSLDRRGKSDDQIKKVIADAALDPMPEVRFAIAN